MKNILNIIFVMFFFSCSITKKEILSKGSSKCIENKKFKYEFYKNINIVDSLITKNQNESFHKSLKFISIYSHVSYESALNYSRTYPYGAYEKDRKGWMDWYEKNKCSNIQLKN
ncbi:hypothetical protein [Chryseobacterium sediminis]|uniref:Lipoprotein n=1 Tax=Chryseobacterium sediminis TaxID=1679494 RepID=A0A5B2UBE4_9FLAO|nr:hypothetical protein [Chryseobacterium sediminis]KAA2223763.1 hypothetical protein FW780_06050 [Chryseobacterium sediminis]